LIVVTEASHVILASAIYKDNHFLLMRDKSAGKIIYNQPAAFLESAKYLIAEAQ